MSAIDYAVLSDIGFDVFGQSAQAWVPVPAATKMLKVTLLYEPSGKYALNVVA